MADHKKKNQPHAAKGKPQSPAGGQSRQPEPPPAMTPPPGGEMGLQGDESGYYPLTDPAESKDKDNDQDKDKSNPAKAGR